MRKNASLLQYIIDDKISKENIEIIKEENNLNNLQLLRKAFKSLNELIYKLSLANDKEIVLFIKRNIQIISFLCEQIEFNEDEVLINIKRIKKARESLLAYANKYEEPSLQMCANKLDEIIIDKNVDIDDLLILIKKLIDKNEDPNIIKKFINANKGIIILEHCELFDYTFNLAINSINKNDRSIFYYITLLKLFYNSRIDKRKYLQLISDIDYKDHRLVLINELNLLILGNKRPLLPEQILDKYSLSNNLPDQTINIQNSVTTDNTIITIDEENTFIRDDAFSIKKDGNHYIVGIHIADVGRNIIPLSDVDITAKTNFKCMYAYKGVRLLSNNIENSLSLNQNNIRNAITLNVVMNDSGDIIDYYIIEDDIFITRNLSYKQSNNPKGGNNYKEIEKVINTLYMISKALESKDYSKKEYWKRKDLAKHIQDEPGKGEIITRELMVLYNNLMGYAITEKHMPYVYKYQEKEYISKLIKDLNLNPGEETFKIINGIFLNSKYSSYPRWHNGLKKFSYSQSTDPLRKYPDLYSQYLLHQFYFKDKDFNIGYEEVENMIDYFNQRNFEINLMRAEYSRGLKLLKKD